MLLDDNNNYDFCSAMYHFLDGRVCLISNQLFFGHGKSIGNLSDKIFKGTSRADRSVVVGSEERFSDNGIETARFPI